MTDPLLIKLVQALAAFAEAGEVCPLNADLALQLGVREYKLTKLFTAAAKEGWIIIHGTSDTRQIEIVATGKRTAKRKRSIWAKSPTAPKVEQPSGDVKAARVWLQSRGYPVYRAAVAGITKDPEPWVIGSHDRLYSDTQLVNFARSRGWKAHEGRAAA
ncbi:MAG TPA: hypothetical protein VIG90_12830 [Pedomonas sp.]|uniref:hypothetical protein n=1 Tax=Pedomonas sp. TaxID=2976421 RepID=UPI002F401C27